ncbi:M23 family metallopeptidase [uncultured Alistipes sp.]|uniref:M23 family metallopeptidase n=1 Tax=uncultured Alistipes sp. TaxID=538949 RepID=UPI0028047760|nr:M23 family metallopeptidase [uncultured Alistipes sp.]
MSQKGHRFNTEALRAGAGELTHEAQVLTHDVVTAPFRLKTYRLIRKILIGFILVSIANVLFSYFFYTPKMYRILRDNRETVIRYRILQDRIRTAQRRVDEIRHRDSYVYRSLFSTDTISIPGVWKPYPDSKYASMADDDYAPLMVGTWRQIDALARTLYLESVSMDELQQLSQNKEQLAMAVPAIWPIDRKALHNNHIGAFNPRRFHPILHRIVAHEGIDFGCDRGTPVYATGDAVVEIASENGYNGGYGHQVLLNHEFGYKTRYAHLSDVLVKPGDRVKRGQIIARTGNTGRSSGPHLHYEVIHKGVPVNPINYFNRDMSAEEYERLMENLRETNFEKY